jgi:hypothetical protein
MRKGFRNSGHVAAERAAKRIGIGIAAGEDDREIRMQPSCLPREFGPVHAGHREIENGQRRRACLQEPQRLGPALRFLNAIVERFESAGDGATHVRIVIDHEHRLARARFASSPCARRFGTHGVRHRGPAQPDVNGCALAGTAVDPRIAS